MRVSGVNAETDTFSECCKRRIYGIFMEISKSPAGDASNVQVFFGEGAGHDFTSGNEVAKLI